MKKIKVLIVEDSAIMRKFLTDILSSSPNIEVVGTSIDPYFALKKIKSIKPDVMTLDIQMPRMDGLTFLSRLMITHPMPVVMVSSFTKEGSEEAIRAIQLGAVDFIHKPNYDEIKTKEALINFTEKLIEKIDAASKTKIDRKSILKEYKPVKKKKLTKEISSKVIAIGASTGGVAAISDIVSSINHILPGIVIVQHMPKTFTKAFADRINQISQLHIDEAKHGDILYTGTAFIAPGDKHMLLEKEKNGYKIILNDDEPHMRHKPSVDKLFYSVADTAEHNAYGILLTGMGEDGARGLLEMSKKGAVTMAQDEKSSIVFGMPMKAIEFGAAKMVKNIDQIIKYLNLLNN